MFPRYKDREARFEELFETAKDVLVLEFWNVEPQLEISIEIALRLGEQANYIHGGAILPYSQGYRRFKNKIPPEVRMLRILSESGYKGKSRALDVLSASQYALDSSPFNLPLPKSSFRSNEAFLWTFGKNCNAGRSVLASLIDIKNDQSVDINQEIDLSNLLLDSYLSAFRVTLDILSENQKVSHVVLFNGRFPETAGAADAAKTLGCNVMFHERSYANENEFSLTPYEVHDFQSIKNDVIKIGSGVQKKDLLESLGLFKRIASGNSLLGVQFYGKKNIVRWSLANIPVFRFDLTTSRTEGKTVLFATCSDDEFFFSDSGALKNPYSDWGDQKNAIRTICHLCKDLGYTFILRIHPHTVTKSLRVISEWIEVSKDVITSGGYVYAPQDPTSVYTLIARSDIFITAASQSGIEACALGKPTINIRESRYNDMGCGAVKIEGVKELAILLKDDRKLSSITVCSKPELYSYWMTQQSYPFKHVHYHNKAGYLGTVLLRPENLRYLWARKINRFFGYIHNRIVCYLKGRGFAQMFITYYFHKMAQARLS